MERELKIPKTYSLDPIVAAWVANQAALRTIENRGETSSSASEVVNEILTAAMHRSNAEADANHVAKMVKRQLLKQK